MASNFTTSVVMNRNVSEAQEEGEVWTTYGLFQLCGHLACSTGTDPSPNICGIKCSNLVDDDIEDDISCVIKVFKHLVEKGFGASNWKELSKVVRLIINDQCKDKQAAEYFAECL